MSAGHQALLMAAGRPDPYWAFVKALLHFDGDYADFATPTTSWSPSNGGTLTTSPVLAGSASFDGTANNSSNVAGGAVTLNIGTSDFCLEVAFYDPSAGTRNQSLLLMQANSNGQSVRFVCNGSSNLITADVSGGGASPSGYGYAFNAWHHLAVTRFGSAFSLWLDGLLCETWTNSSFNAGGAGLQFWLGSSSSPNSGRQVYLDEFRLTVGVPRYTAPFTPTYPYPNF